MLDLSDRGSEFKAPVKAQGSYDKNESSAPDKLPEVGKLYRFYKGGLVITKEIFTIEPISKPGVTYWHMEFNDKVFSCSCSDFLNKISASNSEQTKYTLVNIPTGTSLIKEFCRPLLGPALDEIIALYNTSYRKYHRAWHLEWLFTQVKKLDLKLSKEQILAILFHNVVYTPGVGNGQNETASALLFKRYAQDLSVPLSVDEEQLICALIQDTGTKKPSHEKSKIIIDLDNLSLADTGVEFCAWEELIWLENRHLMDKSNPKKDFDTRRLKYVISLTKEANIFYELRQFEPIARQNIEGLRQAWVHKYKKAGS